MKKLLVLLFALLFVGCVSVPMTVSDTGKKTAKVCIKPGPYVIEFTRVFVDNNKRACGKSSPSNFLEMTTIKRGSPEIVCGNISTAKRYIRSIYAGEEVVVLTLKNRIVGTLAVTFPHCQLFYDLKIYPAKKVKIKIFKGVPK
jgi:hypothetical protein